MRKVPGKCPRYVQENIFRSLEESWRPGVRNWSL